MPFSQMFSGIMTRKVDPFYLPTTAAVYVSMRAGGCFLARSSRERWGFRDISRAADRKSVLGCNFNARSSSVQEMNVQVQLEHENTTPLSLLCSSLSISTRKPAIPKRLEQKNSTPARKLCTSLTCTPGKVYSSSIASGEMPGRGRA